MAARHADRPALRLGERTLTARQLQWQARQLARGLVATGLAKGARVAVLMGNRPEFAVAAFGVALAGGVLVPVNTFATPEERDHILRHSDASLLLMQRELADRDLLGELRAQHRELVGGSPGRLRSQALPQLRRVVCLGLSEGEGGVEPWGALLRRADEVPELLLDALAAQIHPSDEGLLIYTSGTTAQPKGIVHSQRAPVIQSWRFAELMGLGPEDRVFTAQPFFWTAGFAMSLGASLAAGSLLVLQQVFEAGEALELLERERITAVHAWPHQEKALADHPSVGLRDLRSLRKVGFGSPLARLAGLESDVWGMAAAYGLSETFTLVSALPADAPAAQRAACHGKPLPGSVVRIVDPVTGVPVAAGARGEIAVKGLTLMRGYHKLEPELVFDADGFFRSGDEGWLDAEGHLHWTGRLSNLIKTGGANVSPLEIEKALEGHPGLALAAAVGVPHPSLGEAVVLCAVASPGVRVEEEPLRAHLRERLAAYKVPRRVLLFADGELAFTGTRKLALGPLREMALRRLETDGAEIDGHRYGRSG